MDDSDSTPPRSAPESCNEDNFSSDGCRVFSRASPRLTRHVHAGRVANDDLSALDVSGPTQKEEDKTL